MLAWLAMACLSLASPLSLYAQDRAPVDTTDYALIITGGELLRGVYADGHTQFITSNLGPLGCRCVSSIVVGDEADDLMRALAYSNERAELIIVTGGLGPTDDDVTRTSLSEFTGIPLHENPDVIQAMLDRYGASSPLMLRDNMRRQAQTPTEGAFLMNSNGSAVGLVFDDGGTVVAALPGPPRELQPMLKEQLIPYLAERFGIQTIGASLTMRFVNIGESQIDEVMHKHLELPDDLMISSLFNLGRVDLTFSLPGDADEDHAALLELERQLLEHIGDYMYTDEGSTLEDRVIALMQKQGIAIVTAEVGSGGAVSASLGRSENAASVYNGGYIAPNDAVMADMMNLKDDDALSPQETAKTIALAARKRTGSDWGLCIGEIQTDGDRRFVWVALAKDDVEASVRSMSIRGRGETAQTRLVDSTLDWMRRILENRPE